MRFVTICVFILAIALCQPVARAQGVIYKCVGAKGAIAYQNSPCPADAAVRLVKPYVNIPHDPYLEEKVRRDRVALDQRKWWSQGSYGGSAGHGGSSVPPKIQRCRDARARRQSTLDAWGLARTYDLLQRLDREVWEACKDAPGA
jgi:hypothetical protein